MTKSYIEKILKDDKMIHDIAIRRTQFSSKMSNFYFFKTFFESLLTVGISSTIHHKIVPSSGISTVSKIDTHEIIEFSSSKFPNTLSFKFDTYKLNDKLREYNELQKTMGFTESAIYLIDIFLNLLEE